MNRRHSCHDNRWSVVVNLIHLWECRICGARWFPSQNPPARTTDDLPRHRAENVTRYRVWWTPQVPMCAFYCNVPDLATGRLVEDILARYDLFQYENRIKPDYANAGGVQVYDEEMREWISVDDES